MDDMTRIAADVAKIRTDVDAVLHGNHRKGLRDIADAVFGPPGRPDDGLVKRVATIEQTTREGRFLQRGIAIGVALVLVEGAFNINLTRLIAAWFGGGS